MDERTCILLPEYTSSHLGVVFHIVREITGLDGLDKYLLWYSLTSLLALLYLISKLSDWLWASASRWLTTLHSVWASCQYLIKRVGGINTHLTVIIVFIMFLNVIIIFAGLRLPLHCILTNLSCHQCQNSFLKQTQCAVHGILLL